MARWPRLIVPGVPLHITQRGNDRQPIFRTPRDFTRFRALLVDACVKDACALHAYALMSNHVHLLLTPDGPRSAARLMQRIGRAYVAYFNLKYGRTGTLWEGRFKSSLIDSTTYFLHCSRYIDLNPVRAGLVAEARAYGWSSYRHLAHGAPDPLITPHAEYLALGASDRERRRVYRELCALAVAAKTAAAIRHATAGGSALGRQSFRDTVERRVRRAVLRLPYGGDRVGDGWQATAAAQAASAQQP